VVERVKKRLRKEKNLDRKRGENPGAVSPSGDIREGGWLRKRNYYKKTSQDGGSGTMH